MEWVDKPVAELASVRIGCFRAPREHPLFGNSGPTENWLVVFPRTRVWIQHSGGQPVLADASRAMLYNRGQEYRRSEVDDDGDRCEWFAFSPELIAEAHARFEPAAADRLERPFNATHARADAATYALQRRVFLHAWAAHTSPKTCRLDPLFVEESAIAILANVVAAVTCDASVGKTTSRRATKQTHADVVSAVKQIASSRLDEPLSLADVAGVVGRSPFHVARIFQSSEQIGIHAYRMQLRLRASLEPVAEGADLTDTALELGFSSHSHFTVAFARAFGQTPTAFREQTSSKKLKAAARRFRQR